MQINTNIGALSVYRHYSYHVAGLRRSLGHLAAGLRINTGADDPAGLAMSERLRAQYRNAAAAACNVENKLNYLQTTDGWLQKINDLMRRMGELAVMANDGTRAQTDRDNLQREFEQLQKEIQRITSGATAAGKFNGLYLFRGGTGQPAMSGDLVDGISVRTRGVATTIGHDGSTMTAATWSATYNSVDAAWTFRNETTGVVAAVVHAPPDQGLSVNLEGAYGFRFEITKPEKGIFSTNDRFTWTNVPYVPPSGGTTSFFNRGVTGAAGISTQLGTGSGVSSSAWEAVYDAGAQLWTIRNVTTGMVAGSITATPNQGGAINLEGVNGFRFTITAPTQGTYATGDRFAWSNTAYVPPPLGNPVLTDHTGSTQGSGSTAMLGDGADLVTASWQATYNPATQLWTVRNLTTGTDVGVIAAAPNQGGTLNNIGGAAGFCFTVNAPGGGTEYTVGDRFNWTTQAYVAPVLSASTFVDDHGPTLGSATTTILGNGQGISAASWRATYDSVTQRWTVRNLTTGTDVGVIAAAPNAGGSLDLEGGNGFRFTIQAPTAGTQYTRGDRFDWINTAYAPPVVNPPAFVGGGAGSGSNATAGTGAGISTANWSATYDADAEQWTIRNETTGIVVGFINAAPDAGGAILLEGPNGFMFTVDAPGGADYQTGDRFTWSNTAAVPATAGSPVLTDNTDATVGTSNSAILGNGDSIPTATWVARYNAVAQRWTITNFSSGVDVGFINAAPDTGGTVNLLGPNGFSFTVNAPAAGVYNTGDFFSWSTTAHIDRNVAAPIFTDVYVPTVAISQTSQLGDGTSVTNASWSAIYDAVARLWTIRNITTGAVVGSIAAAPDAGGAINLEGANGFRYTIQAPTSGLYNSGDRYNWSNLAHTPPVLGNSSFQHAAPVVSAATVVQGDGYDIPTADWRATYDAMAQTWTVRNLTTGFDYGSFAAAPNAGGTLSNISGAFGFRLTINAPTAGSFSTGDFFEWQTTRHEAAVPGVADFRDYTTLRLSLQVGPDSNQVFREADIILEADYYRVIGSYVTYRYGSVNMTLLGSLHRAVTWASLICPQNVRIEAQSLAQAAVDKINLGIDHLSGIRAVVGAEMNRMQQTLNGLRNYEQNIRATESRIRDVDAAWETAELARQQILVQIGVAMLAQANAMSAMVLNLVR